MFYSKEDAAGELLSEHTEDLAYFLFANKKRAKHRDAMMNASKAETILKRLKRHYGYKIEDEDLNRIKKFLGELRSLLHNAERSDDDGLNDLAQQAYGLDKEIRKKLR